MKWHRNISSACFFRLPRCSLFQLYITLNLHPSLSCTTVLTRLHIITSSVCELEVSFLTCHLTVGSEEIKDICNLICGYIITSKDPVEISKWKFDRLHFKLRFSQTFLLFIIHSQNQLTAHVTDTLKVWSFISPTCFGRSVSSSGSSYGYNMLCSSKFSSLVYELSEDGTDVPKHVGIVKNHTFKCICISCI